MIACSLRRAPRDFSDDDDGDNNDNIEHLRRSRINPIIVDLQLGVLSIFVLKCLTAATTRQIFIELNYFYFSTRAIHHETHVRK